MSVSKEDIFNNALAIIGGPDDSDYIEDADTDNSTQAVWLQLGYAAAVDHAIINVEPREARAFEEISATGDTVKSSDFDYVYDRPVDCLLIKKLTSSTDRTAEYEYEEFGQYIMSDYDADYIEYYRALDYDDTAKFSTGLADVISARLAWKYAGVWKPEMLSAAVAYYNAALEDARLATVGDKAGSCG